MSLRDEVENQRRTVAVKQQVEMDRQSNRAQQEAIINSRFEKMAKSNEDWLRGNILSIVQEFNLLFLNGEGEITIGHYREHSQAFGEIRLFWKSNGLDYSHISFLLESGTVSIMHGKQERPDLSIWILLPWKGKLEKYLADIIVDAYPKHMRFEDRLHRGEDGAE